MTHHVEIDAARCSGHGRCYTLAEDYFEPDDEGFPVILHPVADGPAGETLLAAVRNCPERAIRVDDGT